MTRNQIKNKVRRVIRKPNDIMAKSSWLLILLLVVEVLYTTSWSIE